MKPHPHKDIIVHWLDGGNVSGLGSNGGWFPDYGEVHRKHGLVPDFPADAQFRITPKPETITYSVALFEDTCGKWTNTCLSTTKDYAAWKERSLGYRDFTCWLHLDEVFELPASK